MSHIVCLIVGDWSRDGHGMSEKIIFNCNKSSDVVYDAYKKGKGIIGFDLTSLCDDYRQGRLSWDELQKLRAAGFTDELEDEITPERSIEINKEWRKRGLLKSTQPDRDWAGAALDPETYATVYMFIAKLGNASLTYELAKMSSYPIGGYGLFSI